MSDWVVDVHNHSDGHPPAEARRAAAAGGDLFMPGSQTDFDGVMGALKAGEVSRHQLEVNGSRIYRMAQRLNA